MTQRYWWTFFRLAPRLLTQINPRGGSNPVPEDGSNRILFPPPMSTFATVGETDLLVVAPAQAIPLGGFGYRMDVRKAAQKALKELRLNPGIKGRADGGLTSMAASLGTLVRSPQPQEHWPKVGIITLATHATEGKPIFDSIVKDLGTELGRYWQWDLDGFYSRAVVLPWRLDLASVLVQTLRRRGWDTYSIPIVTLDEVFAEHSSTPDAHALLRAIVSAQPGLDRQVRENFTRLISDLSPRAPQRRMQPTKLVSLLDRLLPPSFRRSRGPAIPKPLMLFGEKDVSHAEPVELHLPTYLRTAWETLGECDGVRHLSTVISSDLPTVEPNDSREGVGESKPKDRRASPGGPLMAPTLFMGRDYNWTYQRVRQVEALVLGAHDSFLRSDFIDQFICRVFHHQAPLTSSSSHPALTATLRAESEEREKIRGDMQLHPRDNHGAPNRVARQVMVRPTAVDNPVWVNPYKVMGSSGCEVAFSTRLLERLRQDIDHGDDAGISLPPGTDPEFGKIDLALLQEWCIACADVLLPAPLEILSKDAFQGGMSLGVIRERIQIHTSEAFGSAMAILALGVGWKTAGSCDGEHDPPRAWHEALAEYIGLISDVANGSLDHLVDQFFERLIIALVLARKVGSPSDASDCPNESWIPAVSEALDVLRDTLPILQSQADTKRRSLEQRLGSQVWEKEDCGDREKAAVKLLETTVSKGMSWCARYDGPAKRIGRVRLCRNILVGTWSILASPGWTCFQMNEYCKAMAATWLYLIRLGRTVNHHLSPPSPPPEATTSHPWLQRGQFEVDSGFLRCLYFDHSKLSLLTSLYGNAHRKNGEWWARRDHDPRFEQLETLLSAVELAVYTVEMREDLVGTDRQEHQRQPCLLWSDVEVRLPGRDRMGTRNAGLATGSDYPQALQLAELEALVGLVAQQVEPTDADPLSSIKMPTLLRPVVAAEPFINGETTSIGMEFLSCFEPAATIDVEYLEIKSALFHRPLFDKYAARFFPPEATFPPKQRPSILPTLCGEPGLPFGEEIRWFGVKKPWVEGSIGSDPVRGHGPDLLRLLRTIQMEIACIETIASETHARTPTTSQDQYISWNITPHLVDPQHNPWWEETTTHMVTISAEITSSIGEGWLPIIEIREGPISGAAFTRLLKQLDTALALAWDEHETAAHLRRHPIIAIDDQWGPQTDAVRLKELCLLAHNANWELALKIDFKVVRGFLSDKHWYDDEEDNIGAFVNRMSTFASAALHSVGSQDSLRLLVFEGARGEWDDAHKDHSKLFIKALPSVSERLHNLGHTHGWKLAAQGIDLPSA